MTPTRRGTLCASRTSSFLPCACHFLPLILSSSFNLTPFRVPRRLKRYAEAVKDYTHALEIEPNNSTAYHNRGSLLERLGNLKNALADFNKAIELDPKSALSYNARGLLLERISTNEAELEKSIQDFNRAVALEPNNPVFLR